MLPVTLENLVLLTGVVLLAGSLLGSVLAFLGRTSKRHAAQTEARRFAAGGYERPIGWPEPAWSTGPVATRTYRTANPPGRKRTLIRFAAVCATAFTASAAGLHAYIGTWPSSRVPGYTAECPVPDGPGAADGRCIRIAAGAHPPQLNGLSEKLSETRLVWPETLTSR